MKNHFQLIKEYLTELNYVISKENETEGILVVQKESNGVRNLILGVAEPILILEQFIFKINNQSEEVYKSLLQKNRDIIHGAFVLDDNGDKVIFRDTLQLSSLDINELEASLNSLGLLLSEYADNIIRFSKY